MSLSSKGCKATDKERYTIELYNRAKEAESEAREWKQTLIDFDKFGDMKTPIGLLPINTDGMRQLVDGCLKLRRETAKNILQELFNMAREQGKNPIQTPVNWVENVKVLAKEYGVEIK